MDRFKFRAYIKGSKKLLAITEINFQQRTLYVKGFKYGSPETYTFEEVELVQCTGLKDKNGKLMYEGDIVRHELIETLELFTEEKSEIKLAESQIIFNLETASFRLGISQRFKIHYNDVFAICAYKHIEVIGSIYDNSDLVENNNCEEHING